MISKEVHSIKVPTIPVYHRNELHNYVTINLHNLPSNITTEQNAKIHYPKITKITLPPIPSFRSDEDAYSMDLSVKLHAPKVNLSFSKHDYVDWSILHCRFDHVKDEKLADMCKL